MNRIVAVRGVVFYESKLLCVRLKPYRGDSSVMEYWCLPGGRLDEGEDIMSGVRREMLEETGIEPEVGRLLYVQQYDHKGEEFIEFFFHIENGKDYLDIDLSKTSHGEEEIDDVEFVDPTKSYILPEFLSEDSLEEVISNISPAQVMDRLSKK